LQVPWGEILFAFSVRPWLSLEPENTGVNEIRVKKPKRLMGNDLIVGKEFLGDTSKAGHFGSGRASGPAKENASGMAIPGFTRGSLERL